MTAPVHVLVFGRSPVAGRAKTRLIPALGAQGAADLYRLLLEHALATAAAAEVDQVSLWLDAQPIAEEVSVLAGRYGVEIAVQRAGDLGLRMHDALSRTLAVGALPLLMGSDVPALRPAMLEQAAMLLRAGHDVVLSPALDGGYGLIGVVRSLPVLFEAMPWSTESVLAETRARCAREDIDLVELAALWDLDEPADLPRLAEVPELADWRRRIRVDAGP